MFEYIVGIDFGHGETAAWVVPVNEKNPALLEFNGRSLLLKSSNDVQKRVIPSEVYYKDGVYSLDGGSRSAVITQMKNKVPKLGDKAKAYKEYIRCVVLRLLDLNKGILDKEKRNFVLCMASPTRWTEIEKKEYLNFFNEAIADLGLRFEWIINESDAAFFSRMHNTPYMNDCSLVIDYGSSTIDYTLMENGKKISKNEWSNPQLGASLIEKAMHDKGKEDADYEQIMLKTKALFHQEGLDYIDPVEWINKKCRELKENCYTENIEDFEIDYKLAAQHSGIRNRETLSLRFCWYSEMKEVTKDYCNDVKNDFISLREKILGNNENKVPKHIIMSGGASIMQWVRPLVQEIFPESHIIMDGNPSFVVAEGIALYARAQYKAIDDLVGKIENEDYASMYKKADAKANHQAIVQLCPSEVQNIVNSAPITGEQIRDRFCNFIRGLNPLNLAFCHLVQQNFDNSLKDSIGNAISAAIKNAYGVKVDTSDTKIHIPIEVLSWNADNFVPGGSWYNHISKMIDDSSDKWSFTWEMPRDRSMALKIADGVRIKLQEEYDFETMVHYPENAVNAFANQIKEIAVKEAIRIFYEKQLFTTTFSA